MIFIDASITTTVAIFDMFTFSCSYIIKWKVTLPILLVYNFIRVPIYHKMQSR